MMFKYKGVHFSGLRYLKRPKGRDTRVEIQQVKMYYYRLNVKTLILTLFLTIKTLILTLFLTIKTPIG